VTLPWMVGVCYWPACMLFLFLSLNATVEMKFAIRKYPFIGLEVDYKLCLLALTQLYICQAILKERLYQ
jgi:hypothetical protein